MRKEEIEKKTAEEKEMICNYLKEEHTGKDKAVHSKELERLFHLNGRSVRRRIRALREDGYPICSDETGYYYAENQKDINRTVDRFNENVTGLSNTRTALLYCFPEDTVMKFEVTVKMKGRK